jgi:hypothetical protein
LDSVVDNDESTIPYINVTALGFYFGVVYAARLKLQSLYRMSVIIVRALISIWTQCWQLLQLQLAEDAEGEQEGQYFEARK